MAFSPKRDVADADYFLQRAVAEADTAERARSSKCAEIHHQLASSYLDRVFGEDSDTARANETKQASKSGPAFFSSMLTPIGDPMLEPIPDEFAELLVRLNG